MHLLHKSCGCVCVVRIRTKKRERERERERERSDVEIWRKKCDEEKNGDRAGLLYVRYIWIYIRVYQDNECHE